MSTASPSHDYWMQRALRLARKGEGLTRPNPPVGAVIIKDGKMVGEGFHKKAGGPHAEIFALRKAGGKATGATMYVTLEPCSTWGRTPPCTDAIAAAGVSRVIVSARDPNPVHAGRGLSLLRRKGVKVMDGVCREDGEKLIAPFRKWVKARSPYVTLKLGMTLDGRIADAGGHSKWITGKVARRMVHALRRRADAILVGRQTVATDDPHLIPVPAAGRKPFRVIVDSAGKTPLKSRVFNDEHVGRTILATTRLCPNHHRKQITDRGADIMMLPARDGRVSLASMLRQLARRGIMHVLCEGGGELAAGLIREGLVDEFWIFIAPRILGGNNSVPAIGGRAWLLKSAPDLVVTGVERVGDDILVRANPTERH